MIKAEEAAHLVDNINSEVNKKQMAQMEDLLTQSIKKGVKEFSTEIELTKSVLYELKNLGYKVTRYDNSDPRDGFRDVGYIIKF